MSRSNWHIGDQVLVRGRRWTIRDTTLWSECTLLRLAAGGQPSARALLTPFDRPQRVTATRTIRLVRQRRWLHVLRRIGTDLAPYGAAVATAASPAQLFPHQLEPLLAVLRHGATRLLIADVVGLGKTIQAGLILLELAAQIEEFRAIVIVPAGLRAQWREELLERLDLRVIEADAPWLRAAGASRPADVNPWSLPGIYVASVDFVKRPEVLRALEDVTWDVTVIDEAHLASAASDRRRAAHAVASRSRRTVLLTATPDAGDPVAFAALCSIGMLHPAEPAVLFFRRTRAQVSGGLPRRSILLRVRPTSAELAMHELLERYTRQVWAEAARRIDARAKLATIVLRKRALSSAASLAISAQRRLDLLAGMVEPERQLVLPLEDDEPLADGVDDGELSAPGLADGRRERRWLASIVAAARQAARAESKSARLIRWLSRVSEPVIIFTEYRDTLHRLERLVLATGRPLKTMHGGMERGERSRVQAAFNRGGLSLVATDAAAEGLNLHHHCRIIVHYELPWRPARIEQRAGRVDRIGQSRRVHEIALIAAGTVERLVLAPLAMRAARARAAGDAIAGLLDSLSEAAVSELVMGGALPSPVAGIDPVDERGIPRLGATRDVPHGPGPSVQAVELRVEAAAETARLETARRWARASPVLPGTAPQATTIAVAIRARGRGRRAGAIASDGGGAAFDRPGDAGLRVAGSSDTDGILAAGAGPAGGIVRLGATRQLRNAMLVLVFALTLADVDGRPVHAEARVLSVELGPGWAMGDARSVRRVVDEVVVLSRTPGSAIHAELAGYLAAMMARVSRLREAAHDRLRRREERLGHGQPSAARQMVQAGLFDRRAVRRQARQQATYGEQLEIAAERIRSLDRSAELVAGVDLVAARFPRVRT